MRSHTHPGPSIRGLIDGLAEDRWLDDPAAGAGVVLAGRSRPEIALYLRAVIGVGALIASTALVAALHHAGIVDADSRWSLGITGVLFMLLAVVSLNLAERNPHPVASSFLMQSSFCAMATGKTLVTLLAVLILDSLWAVPLALTVALVASYPVYHASIDRFASAFAVLVSVHLLITFDLRPEPWGAVIHGAFFLACLLGGALAFTDGRLGAGARPMGYAFLVCAVAVALMVDLDILGTATGSTLERLRGPVQIMLTAALAAAVVWAAGGIGSLAREPVRVALAGALALGWVASPGILAGIGMLVFGHALRERVMTALGGAIFVAFLVLYYYSLNLNLAAKAGVLVASGVVLLAARLYLSVRRFV